MSEAKREKVDSGVLRLLESVKKVTFVPNVKFEKLLLTLFYESLSEFAKHFQEESGVLLEVYLECVIIVYGKDPQFTTLIENLNDDVCNHIIAIVRKDDIQCTKPELYWLLLKFTNLIILNVSSKRSIFMGLSLHLMLLKTFKVFHVEHVLLTFDTIMNMIQSPKILKDLSHGTCLNSALAALSSLASSQLDQTSCLVIVEKILNFSISISSYISLNIDQFKNISKELAEKCALFPQHINLFQHLQAILNNAVEQNRNMTVSSTKQIQGTSKEDRCVYLRISQLRTTSNATKLVTPRTMQSSKLVRNGVVSLQDPETNVYRSLGKVADLDDKLAESISGMLNTNRGGKIHIGINKSGMILGIQITRKERDSLRCGIDTLLRKVIKPALPPNALDVQFIPVRSLNACGEENLFVVILTVPPNMNTLYYLSETEACFLRLPKGNVRLTLPEVRQQAILLTEKRYWHCA